MAAAGTCSPDRAATLMTMTASDIPKDEVLFWSFEASNGMRGEGHQVAGTYKALDLEPSGLSILAIPTGRRLLRGHRVCHWPCLACD